MLCDKFLYYAQIVAFWHIIFLLHLKHSQFSIDLCQQQGWLSSRTMSFTNVLCPNMYFTPICRILQSSIVFLIFSLMINM